MKPRQNGFTLVEIAVVLVIVGLLLGGVLKGQELIDSAKVKNLAQDFRTTPMLIHAYQDKFRALPGDDRRAVAHLCPAGAANCTTDGNGDGVLGGNWDDDSGSEAALFWQQVRLANLASGPVDTGDAAYIPRNAEGGRIGIQRGGNGAPLGLTGSHVMCSASINGKLVRQLDQALDDGNPASGALRAGTTGDGGTLTVISSANPLADGNSHTVCLSL
ncbi:prepilin-type N-terminal cleavage/methylation domain-containing protein [Thauera sinica]|uniref:Prepilin-type N-terminal cleavage/methylation domain-containing protein n=1 Tax=Thauera sinica TaxID=2665146 RepID=A0ABW1AXT6_9RHOO|nr:prepilin-type N-terminal cleavage/methylation domain-containing protein [Thauera sp. K11]ATE58675.1 prepilin-type cleavage/methylation domain-containing protein [Thauera sp. K11]